MHEKTLPPNWSWVKLGDVCENIIGGGTPSTKREDYWKGKIPWITSADINGLKKITPRKNINQKAIDESATNLLPKGNIVVVTRVGLGKLAINNFDLCFSQDSQGLVLDKEIIDTEFLAIILSKAVQSFKATSRGTTISGVTKKQLRELKIPLPPIPEQHRIVEKIEELFSELDNGIENLKKSKEQIKTYRQAVLKFAFEGKLLQGERTKDKGKSETGELPEDWEWVKLDELTTKLGDGLHGTPKYSEDGKYFFINGNNLSDGKIEIKENTKRVTSEEYEKYKKPLNENTVFVSINGTLGKTAFYNGEKIILGKSACYFNVNEKLNKYYIRYFLKSQIFLSYANKVATGSTIKNVPLKGMRELLVPLPSNIKVQTQIVEEIERRFSVADKMEAAIDESLKKAGTLRQSILKKAFEGKLVS